MTKTMENFEKIIREKNLPISKSTIEGGHSLYRFRFSAPGFHSLIAEVILEEADADYNNGQIIYRQLYILADYDLRQQALQFINELNGGTSAYYTLHLAGDGEIFMRTLMRVGPDAEPLYQTIVLGSNVAQQVMTRLSDELGPSGPIE